ncbi:MAG: 1-deoxy-D-xylulose-5-phosphate reductoisomerase, partial [Firmicutes bacterium]|nr:1-deoxy-D-xylulose-5-phosphate reductoisomerase [Bacillota bacterium]
VMNAANEAAVAAFLKDRVSFLGIADVVEGCMDAFSGRAAETLDDVFEIERETRERAERLISAC